MKSVMVRFKMQLGRDIHVLTFQFRGNRAWFIADDNLVRRQHFSLRSWKLQYPFSDHVEAIRHEYRRIVAKYRWNLPEHITNLAPDGKIDLTMPSISLIVQYEAPMLAMAEGLRDFWHENGIMPDIPVYLVSETPAKMIRVVPKTFMRVVE